MVSRTQWYRWGSAGSQTHGRAPTSPLLRHRPHILRLSLLRAPFHCHSTGLVPRGTPAEDPGPLRILPQDWEHPLGHNPVDPFAPSRDFPRGKLTPGFPAPCPLPVGLHHRGSPRPHSPRGLGTGIPPQQGEGCPQWGFLARVFSQGAKSHSPAAAARQARRRCHATFAHPSMTGVVVMMRSASSR